MKIEIYSICIIVFLSSCMSAPILKQTETPTLAPTPKPTFTQITLPTLSPTPNASEKIVFSMLSPDGTKIIQTADWGTFDILDIKSKKLLWSFSYDRTKFKLNGTEFYLYEAGYSPFYWSQDGRYIYVTADQGGDGGVKYFGNVFGANDGVSRFDLDTGIMTEILPEILHVGGYTFTFTPDKKDIIYINQRDTPLVLRRRDLFTNEEKDLITFDENMLDVGDYAWSPEGDKLLFQTMDKNGMDFLLLDLRDGKFQVLIQNFQVPVHFDFWGELNQIYYSNWKKEVWQLDLESQTINFIGTTTPKP